VDDRTVGLVLRALRRRRGWRQVDLAGRAGCSQALVSTVERGHVDQVTVETLRSVFGAVDARITVEPRWRGAELDRLLDRDHAAISRVAVARLEAAGWVTLIEVTYAIRGERGSIDILAVEPARRAALVLEIKSDIGSAEATGRKLDEKRRLAPAIVRERFGWTPEVVGAVLVLPDATRLRDLLAGPAAVLARMFPIASRRVAAWLREPEGPLAATWILRNISLRNAPRVRRGPVARVRRPNVLVRRDPSVEQVSDEPPGRILR
jgi:transcriptional regulator with XRE-family HTH domain